MFIHKSIHKSIKTGFLFFILIAVPSCKGETAVFDVNNLIGKENLVDVLICGSGPAGLNAAIHGARSGLKTVVLEGAEPGGQLTKSSGVENYPGFSKIPGMELIDTVRKQTEDFGAEFLSDAIVGVDFSSWPYKVTTEGGLTIHAMTLIVATGSSPKMLGVPGEELYYGRGVGHCAICDGPFYKGQQVVVIGGGDSAVEEAVQLINFGVGKVIVLVRADRMRAIKSGQDRLKKEDRVQIKHNTGVIEILGDGNGVVGVKVFDKETGEYIIEAKAVFEAIGSTPNTGFLQGKAQMDERGYLKMKDRSQETTIKGVYAAGDVESNRPKQAIIASGMGCQAGIEAVKFLTEELGLDRKFMSKLKYYKGKATGQESDKDSHVVQAKEITSGEQFKKEVLDKNSGLVLVDFYTESCVICKKVSKDLEGLETDFAGKLKLFKIDAMGKDVIAVAQQYSVTQVPRLLLFKNGNILKDYSGQVPTIVDLTDLLNKNI